MGLATMRQTQTIVIEAKTAEALEAKLPRINLGEGSTGRIEFYSGAWCLLQPLGPLMNLPIAGSLFANKFTPAGAEITDRGGFGTPGPIDCNAFVEWVIPVSNAQDLQFRLGPVALVAIGAALAAVLFGLGWLIDRIRMIIEVVTEIIGDVIPDFLKDPIAVVAIIGAALLLAFSAVGKRG